MVIKHDIIEELCKSIPQRYQERLEEKRKEVIWFAIMLIYFYYHLHETILKRGKSYIKSPEWLKNKRATINTKKKKMMMMMIISFSVL